VVPHNAAGLDDGNRDEVSMIIRHTLDRSDITGSYAAFEPNEFDGPGRGVRGRA
jgi:hypothetical protein